MSRPCILEKLYHKKICRGNLEFLLKFNKESYQFLAGSNRTLNKKFELQFDFLRYATLEPTITAELDYNA